MLTVLAPAKLNLVLEVLGKRSDGYHEVRSLIQTINLCDRITFERASEISLECDEPSLQGADNLVLRAALLLKEVTGFTKGMKIKLEKHIPWGMGLGGGSSDAAVTLLALNQLWGLNLTMTKLMRLAAQLGSDAPFFLYRGTAVVSGRGEKVRPLANLAPSWFVVLVPPLPRIPQKTKHLYNSLTAEYFTRGEFTKKAVRSCSRAKSFNKSLLFDVFEKVAFDIFLGLRDYRECFIKAGASNVCLAGSGLALFSLVETERMGKELYSRLYSEGVECYLVSTFVPEV